MNKEATLIQLELYFSAVETVLCTANKPNYPQCWPLIDSHCQ